MKAEDIFKVLGKGKHVHCKSVAILESVQHRDVATTDQ